MTQDPTPTPTDAPAAVESADIAGRLEQARRELLELSTRNLLLSTPRRRRRSRVLEITGEDADALYDALVVRGRVLHFAPAPPAAEAAETDADAQGDKATETPADAGDGDTAETADGEPSDPDPADAGGSGPSDRPAVGVEIEPGSAGDAFHQHHPATPPPAPEADAETDNPAPPEAAFEEAQGSAESSQDLASVAETRRPEVRPDDQRLQTLLEADDLQKRLLRTFYDARSSQQEQGVNTLYLAVGFLRWYDPADRDKPRDAPLLLIPCVLERENARTRFSLRCEDPELSTNLSLQAKLRAEFGIELPEVDTDPAEPSEVAEPADAVDPAADPDAPDTVAAAEAGDSAGPAETAGAARGAELAEASGFRPSAYFAAVRAAVADVPRWEVLEDDAVLSFFSFSKFLMYRDLDPTRLGLGGAAGDGAADEPHPLLSPLLGDAGFASPPPVLGEGQSLDEVVGPREMVHVVPADASQTVAVEAVRRGRNLVIQGPPGTGKSQTIANLIAAAVHAGKSVLFVAEKMAALEVVQRRLANVGLGEMCLELHSHKATKRRVLEDLEQTLALGEPPAEVPPGYFERLIQTRDTLNRHAQQLHAPIDDSGLSPYAAVGELIRLHGEGVTPPDFRLDTAAGWSAAEAESARRALSNLMEQVEALGDAPASQAWRGAGVDGLLPMDRQRLIEQLPTAVASLTHAEERVRALADVLDVDDRATPELGRGLAHRARRLADAPAVDPEAIVHAVWDQQLASVSGAVETGLALSAVRQQLEGRVVDAAFDTDLTQARLEIATHGRSWLGWLSSAYRRARRQLASLTVGPLPRGTDAQLQLIDQVIEARKARQAVDRDEAIGRYAFGHHWRGEASDWDHLGRVHGWNRRNQEHGDAGELRRLAARGLDPAALRPLADAAESAVDSAERAFDAAVRPVRLDLDEAFGVGAHGALPLGEAARRLQRWEQQPDGVSRWIGYRRARDAAQAAGLDPLVDGLEAGRLGAADAPSTLAFAYHEALLRHGFSMRPELASFTGETHENTLQRFRQLDADRLALARQEVAAAHHENLPRGNVGQMGILRREFQKKRRHLPLRVLLREAGLAVRAIKPVFMMSPMSVAQYLEPGEVGGGGSEALRFDLLLIDEASQVRPVDALGAAARCRQLVVVGDDKQLPPTRFFDAILAHDDEPLDTDLDTGDLESILGLCSAQNMPSTMLNWHYRSVHPSLIAVSNREFYDSQLHVIPSPRRDPEDLGLRFHLITEGHFDRGGSATHAVEARRIAEAVVAFARDTPHRSLGVGAFSVGQRDAILDELETLRRAHPELETFFAEDREEPFFVKNLENIQGDERDVIFISVGYGPDAEGRVSMNFGPLSNDGGERRLNVLITRAKRRLEVFSSMTAEDIDLSRVSKRGPEAFRTFLRYAQTGRFDTAKVEREEQVTAFEQRVAEALRAAGYETAAHVGERGFDVDLAVLDPDRPGRYLLGILTDGPAYGRCRSARERDASREQVLQMRGWQIHRLWQLDWFNRPQQQLEQIVAALEAARVGEPGAAGPAALPSPPPRVERARPPAAADESTSASRAERFAGIPNRPYEQANFKKIRGKEIEELDHVQRLALIRQIVEAEAPVHREEVVRRAADIYRVERLTEKIGDLLATAVGDAVHAGQVAEEGGFLTPTGFAGVDAVRRRTDVASAGLRKPDRLPPSEVRFALMGIVQQAIGVSRDDAVIEASRLLGFSSTRRPLRDVIEPQLQALIDAGQIEDRGEAGLFAVDPASPTQPAAES